MREGDEQPLFHHRAQNHVNEHHAVMIMMGDRPRCVIHSFKSPGMEVKLTKLAKMVAAISSP